MAFGPPCHTVIAREEGHMAQPAISLNGSIADAFERCSDGSLAIRDVLLTVDIDMPARYSSGPTAGEGFFAGWSIVDVPAAPVTDAWGGDPLPAMVSLPDDEDDDASDDGSGPSFPFGDVAPVFHFGGGGSAGGLGGDDVAGAAVTFANAAAGFHFGGGGSDGGDGAGAGFTFAEAPGFHFGGDGSAGSDGGDGGFDFGGGNVQFEGPAGNFMFGGDDDGVSSPDGEADIPIDFDDM